MPLIEELYNSDFRTKLALAHQLFQEHGETLGSMPPVRQGLVTLEKQAQSLQEHMSFLDADNLCSHCAQKPGGGCCSLYMADENDSILLLINLLAGHQVSIQKDDGFECYLLGSTGCALRFKPMFCLNYNCHAIKVHTDADILSSYLASSAQLLQSQWHTETLILSYLRSKQNN